ncbi:MAG: MMPL family transporter [Methylovirgula sp.]|jgi:hopanoid biosynthesis associated RND transporter like protein HpnN
MTDPSKAKDPAAGPQPIAPGPISKFIAAMVDICVRHAWVVIVIAAIVTATAAHYAATHFKINTNTDDFLSASLPWRQRLIELDKYFPQRNNEILVVIDGKTPELAESAAAQLSKTLATRPDLFKRIERPDGGPYFNRNGLLFQPVPEVAKTSDGLLRAQPFLGTLTADPSLRGVMDAFSFINRGVRSKAGTYNDFDRPIVQFSDTLADILAGKPAFFSWSTLLSGQPPDPQRLTRFISILPVLDYAALQPGKVPSDFIRNSAKDLGLTPENGVKVRLTGRIPLEDDEFSTVQEGSGLNAAVMAGIVLFIIWMALKSMRIVLAVALSVLVGLAITAAVGLLMVKALNLISVAFAVLFVGIGVDFGIQFSVRYRAERHDEPDIYKALHSAAVKVGRPLALAAAATTAGFYSFLPTDYRGVSELGLIAGTGMIIAFFTSISVLPALLRLLHPPAESEPVGYKFLAPVDAALSNHRYAIVIGTLLVALSGVPLLWHVRFDFNPLNLRSHNVESVATLDDLMKLHDSPVNQIVILEPSLDATDPVVAKLHKLPDVSLVLTLNNLVPEDQDQKLPLIEKAAKYILPLFEPNRRLTPPTTAQEIAAMNKAADQFATMAEHDSSKGGADARKLATLIRQLANVAPEKRDVARQVLLPGLDTTLDLLHQSLEAKKTGLDDIPPLLKEDWVSPIGGRALIQVAPNGDSNDNAFMTQFANSVLAVAPNATGEPIAVQESGKSVIRAFIEAGAWALLSISVLLFIVLRRVTDVLLTLVPLLLAGLVSLEITVIIGMPLNFANIIALPLLLGLGVAFKIYFVMAWRAGTTNLLQSSLTRAVFFSAMTSATAFGSLWFSHHPGTSSMGKLLAISLVTTLCAAVLFQPALMGPPRKVKL